MPVGGLIVGSFQLKLNEVPAQEEIYLSVIKFKVKMNLHLTPCHVCEKILLRFQIYCISTHLVDFLTIKIHWVDLKWLQK
jgi:NADPH-dependent 7-cyano-7-deazaguanine reductase QueF